MMNRRTMEKALLARAIPVIRERGFAGRFPHFRRPTPTKTDLMTFQFDRHGGGFVIEVAEAPSGDIVKPWGKVVPAHRVTAYDINPPKRQRLQPGDDRSLNSWFRFDGELSADDVVDQVLGLLPQLDDWFAGRRPQKNIR